MEINSLTCVSFCLSLFLLLRRKIKLTFFHFEKAFNKLPRRKLVHEVINNVGFSLREVVRSRIFFHWQFCGSSGFHFGYYVFLLFINYTCNGLGSFFENNTNNLEIYHPIISDAIHTMLQLDIDRIGIWARGNSLPLNIKKINVISHSRKTNVSFCNL